MILTFERNNGPENIQMPSKSKIEDAIDRMDAQMMPYLILEDSKGNYIQCAAGEENRFVVETRIHFDSKKSSNILLLVERK